MNLQHQLQTQEKTVGFMDTGSFELSQRVATMFSKSTLVPREYQGNLPNCIIALNMAQRIGADPLMVMQNLVVVHGRPTWSSQFLIATFNTCGRFSSIRFEFFGEKGTDNYGCRATAIELSTGEKLVGTDVTIGISKSEGWFGRNGSKWKTMPDQMLRYRAASWFIRAIAPELSMGLHTQEEIIDIEPIDVTPPRENIPEKKPEKPKTSVTLDSLIGGEEKAGDTIAVQKKESSPVDAIIVQAQTIPVDTMPQFDDLPEPPPFIDDAPTDFNALPPKNESESVPIPKSVEQKKTESSKKA